MNSPFINLFDKTVKEINLDKYLYYYLFTNGINNLKKGFYKWDIVSEDRNLTFNKDTEIVLTNNHDIPIYTTVSNLDPTIVLLDDEVKSIIFTKDINYNNKIIRKGKYNIRNVYIKYTYNIIIENLLSLSQFELNFLFEKDPDLIICNLDLLSNLSNIIEFYKKKNTYDEIIYKSFLTGYQYDVELRFYYNDNKYKSFYCHKMILSLKSEYFKNSFNFKESDIEELKIFEIFNIKNILSLECVIYFIYCNNFIKDLKFSNINGIIEFLIDVNNLSDFLQITLLKDMLSEIYQKISILDYENKLNIYNLQFINQIKEEIII